MRSLFFRATERAARAPPGSGGPPGEPWGGRGGGPMGGPPGGPMGGSGGPEAQQGGHIEVR